MMNGGSDTNVDIDNYNDIESSLNFFMSDDYYWSQN